MRDRKALPALILAAGSGTRMGAPKALLRWEGETLLQRATGLALAAGCQPVIAVVGQWEPGPLDARVRLVPNPGAAEGMASSIRAGMAALPQEAVGVLLLAVDQIRVQERLLQQLLEAFFEAPLSPVACAYSDTLGIPAILPRRLFPALQALQGDRGAKGILLLEGALTLPFPGGSDDLDTPQDLEAFRR